MEPEPSPYAQQLDALLDELSDRTPRFSQQARNLIRGFLTQPSVQELPQSESSVEVSENG